MFSEEILKAKNDIDATVDRLKLRAISATCSVGQAAQLENILSLVSYHSDRLVNFARLIALDECQIEDIEKLKFLEGTI